MFDITIRCATLADAERVLACLKHDNAPAAAQVAQQLNPPVESGESNAQVDPPKKRGRPRKNTADAPASAPESAASDASQESSQPAASVDVVAPAPAQQTPTFDDTKAALKKLLDKYNGDMAVPLQVLAKFDAERISAVKEADYADFIAACEAA